MIIKTILPTVLLFGAVCTAADWPGHLGPTRNGVTAETLEAKGDGEPARLWEKRVGDGFAGPAVVGGKVVLFHRVDDKEIVECLEARTGKPIWSDSWKTAYQTQYTPDEGPRATPNILNDRVYTLGADGVLGCRQLADGKQLWSVEAGGLLHAHRGFFGFSGSPLIEGDKVIVNLGGKGAGVAAFDRESGKLAWSVLDDITSCSSPVAFSHEGQRYVAAFTGAGLNVLEPATGKLTARYPFRARGTASVNAMTPVIVGDEIFISEAYGTGAALVKFDGKTLEKVWASDEALSCHYNTPVCHEGYLYGFDGMRESPDLRCIEWKTGRVMWTKEGVGYGTLILAGDRLLIQTTKGELIIAPASPKEFKAIENRQLVGTGGRAAPALSDGLYIVRDRSQMVCIDLRQRK